MSEGQVLPAGFEELVPFVAHWAGDTTNDRVRARSVLEMDDIRAFYDAMVPRLEEAMSLVDSHGLDNLPPDAANLAKLVLALGQASVSIEVHGMPRAPGTVYPHGIITQRGPVPFG
jgi:hypothetical protein